MSFRRLAGTDSSHSTEDNSNTEASNSMEDKNDMVVHHNKDTVDLLHNRDMALLKDLHPRKGTVV